LDASLFPYRFRDYQPEFFRFIQSELEKGRNVVVDAATGFGKTPLILAAVLPNAVHIGSSILWAVRTGNEADRPVEELKIICRRRYLELFGFSYRGKRDMCLLLRDLKQSGRLEGHITHEDASLICETYRKGCPYWTNLKKLSEKELVKLTAEPRLYSEILRFCAELKICPYRTQLLLLEYANFLSFSYNYVVDPRISRFMQMKIGFENSILIVDEAHNLQHVAGEVNSDRITLGTVERALKEAKTIGSLNLVSFLDATQAYMLKLRDQIRGEDSTFNVEECIHKCAGDIEAFKEYVKEAKWLGNRIRRRLLREGKAPRSSLHHLGEFWLKVLENLGVKGVAFLASKNDRGNLTVEIFDMRSEELLGRLWDKFKVCIFCSGTIKPVDSFAEVVGLKNYSGRVFPSPYPPENILTLVTRGLTTRGEELGSEMAEAYLATLDACISLLNVNLAVFASSYRIQAKLLQHGLKEVAERHGRRLFVEEQGMSGDEGRRILEEFKQCPAKSERGILCGVAGGRFAEGADLPGRELEAVFLVGVPFERPTVKTLLYIDYYGKIYGEEKGRYYAYTLPALKRASQALGRALRSKKDKAVFILGDERYTRYLGLLPDYVQKTVRKVKGSPENIRRALSRFSSIK
jgi:DNA excision repair protein ERCC-2